MGKEKHEKMPMPEEELKEKKEQAEEIQRLELDPDEGVDIVIKKSAGKPRFIQEPGAVSSAVYFPAQIVFERNGRIVDNLQEDLQEEVPVIGFAFYLRGKERKRPLWGCSEDGRRVLMPRKWESSKDTLSLGHELGHASRALKHPEEVRKERKLLKQKDDIEFQLYTIEERGAIWYRKQPGEVPWERPATKKDKERLAGELKNIYQKLIPLEAKSERGAWAEGLNLIRKINREKGIDLLKPFRGKNPEETRKNIETFVHGHHSLTSLASYEEEFREKIKKMGLSEELKRLFTKRYKERTSKKAKEVSEEVSEKASKI